MKLLTVQKVHERVEAIRAIQRDDETAHSWEDELHQEVLLAIATKRISGSASQIAAAALETRELKFSRWCA